MNITQKSMESVMSELIGEDVFPLVNLLKTTKNISEFQISSKIKQPVDIIRNRLYRLYNHNLVTFIRKKDKKKGWYIYYWTLNLNQIKYLVTDLKKKRIVTLHERVSREEENHFFSCVNKCIRVDFEQATNFEYSCPECGELLHQEDNQKKVEEIKKEIKNLEKELLIESKKVEDLIKKEKDNEENIPIQKSKITKTKPKKNIKIKPKKNKIKNQKKKK